jgi:bifunctional DNA-binding transcriptional regulator/antitoxin component of YhaV-PrlF toxin-antitoxin module
MEVTRVDNAGKITLPLNISNQYGVKPGAQFAVITSGKSIILTKLDQVNPNAGKIQDMLQLSEFSLRDFLQNEPDFPRITDYRVRIVVDFVIS